MRLRESWGRFSLMFSLTQPLDDIRDYFGPTSLGPWIAQIPFREETKGRFS